MVMRFSDDVMGFEFSCAKNMGPIQWILLRNWSATPKPGGVHTKNLR